MHFADDAARVAHSDGQLQSLMNRFYKTCDLFSLTINMKIISKFIFENPEGQ